MAKLADVIIGQRRTGGRQEEVTIALNQMVGTDRLDPKTGTIREDIHLACDQANPVAQFLGDHQTTCLVFIP